MKRKITILLSVILLLIIVKPAMAAEIQSNGTTEVQSNGIIETSATGEIQVDPDIAYLSLAVRTEEENGSLSQQNNATAVNKAMDSLAALGIDKDAIKTTSFWTYSYVKNVKDPNGEKEIREYLTESDIKVSISDLSKVGEILSKLAEQPEVNVRSVNYSIQDPDKYKEQVIKSAINQAKQNLTFSAQTLGMELDKLVNLRISFNENYGSVDYRVGAAAPANDSIPQPQNPDKVKISATADLSYSVK